MRRFFSNAIARLTDCPTASALAVCFLGIFFGWIAYVTNALLMRLGTSGVVYAVVDATVIGSVAATIGAVVLLAIRDRQQRELEYLRSVAELNHHVRNALQVIVDNCYTHELFEPQAVLASTNRIDMTLRKLFPENRVNAGEQSGKAVRSTLTKAA